MSAMDTALVAATAAVFIASVIAIIRHRYAEIRGDRELASLLSRVASSVSGLREEIAPSVEKLPADRALSLQILDPAPTRSSVVVPDFRRSVRVRSAAFSPALSAQRAALGRWEHVTPGSLEVDEYCALLVAASDELHFKAHLPGLLVAFDDTFAAKASVTAPEQLELLDIWAESTSVLGRAPHPKGGPATPLTLSP